MIKRILVPAVGLEQAEQAIEFVAVLAEPNAATVYFLHVTKKTEVPPAVLDYMHSASTGDSMIENFGTNYPLIKPHIQGIHFSNHGEVRSVSYFS